MVPTRHAQVRAAQRGIPYHQDVRRRIPIPGWLADRLYHGWHHKGLRLFLSGEAVLVCLGRKVVTVVRPRCQADEIRAVLLLHGMGFPRADLL